MLADLGKGLKLMERIAGALERIANALEPNDESQDCLCDEDLAICPVHDRQADDG